MGVSIPELRQHIADCGWHLECCYARFQAHGNPADRDAAVQWLAMQQDAQRALQQALEDGCYFDGMGQVHRVDLERMAA